MAWHNAAALNEVIAQRQVVVLDGQKVLLIWHHEQVHAVQAQCPHLKLPLTKGQINEKNELVCPFHKSAFDLCSGEAKCWSPWPPIVGGLLGAISSEKNLKVYPVKIEENRIFVDV